MDSETRTESGPVVVGVDASAGSNAALRWAAQEAARRGVALRIVNAWEPVVMTWPWPPTGLYIEPEPYEHASHTLVADSARSVRQAMGDGAPTIETTAVEATPADALIDRSADASLLVVGSRGRGGFAGLLLGSVAMGCAHRTTVPLAVIHDNAPLPGSGDVVVGVDDSDCARTALRWAAEEAVRVDRRLVVVHGWEPPTIVPADALGLEPRVIEATLESSEREMKAMVEAVLNGMPVRPEITVRAVVSGPAQALVTEAKGAGLLVVGSRGRGSVARMVLGSVSRQCLHHAPCPVVVVPRPTS